MTDIYERKQDYFRIETGFLSVSNQDASGTDYFFTSIENVQRKIEESQLARELQAETQTMMVDDVGPKN